MLIFVCFVCKTLLLFEKISFISFLSMGFALLVCALLFASLLIVFCADASVKPAKDVHFFFYIWYGTPQDDGNWKHWVVFLRNNSPILIVFLHLIKDHEVLPHWELKINDHFPTVGQRHSPPHHIHSPFYPVRGPYSSRNTDVLWQQFEEMNDAGGNVAVISWWGQATKSYSTDTQGICTDKIIEDILRVADSYGKIKIIFHLEPYHSRTVESVREDLNYVISKYGHHSSFYRALDNRPMFYIYDSYHIYPSQWMRLLQPEGDLTIRGTTLDAWVVGLWLDRHHGSDALEGGFDGTYTYFATDNFSFGSSTKNWNKMCEYLRSENMLCILSVGPGYNDSLIRPWNTHNARSRRFYFPVPIVFTHIYFTLYLPPSE